MARIYNFASCSHLSSAVTHFHSGAILQPRSPFSALHVTIALLGRRGMVAPSRHMSVPGKKDAGQEYCENTCNWMWKYHTNATEEWRQSATRRMGCSPNSLL